VAHEAGAYPGFCGKNDWEYFVSPADGMLVHRRVTPQYEIRHYDYILGISECRWRGSGKSKLNTGEVII